MQAHLHMKHVNTQEVTHSLISDFFFQSGYEAKQLTSKQLSNQSSLGRETAPLMLVNSICNPSQEQMCNALKS